METRARPLKILLTNARLAKRTGTEIFVFDLACRLLERGHRPVVYSPCLGRTAQRLREHTVPVVNRLDQVGFVPDIIHGHHTNPTMVAGLRFPHVPVVFVCHSWSNPDDAPPLLPTIRRYLAVDLACRDRLTGELGIPDEKVELAFNFVDLKRFSLRSKLADFPQRALLFSNRAACGFYFHKLKTACRRQRIRLDRIRGIGGPTCEAPESVLPQYDLVFARAKSAIEALAVGNSVIICDRSGMGPLVTMDNFDRLRELNFGRRTFDRPVTLKNLETEIRKYCPADAAGVTAKIRRLANLDDTVDQLLEIYLAAISESAETPMDPRRLLAAAAKHVEALQQRLDFKPKRLARLTSFYRKSIGQS